MDYSGLGRLGSIDRTNPIPTENPGPALRELQGIEDVPFTGRYIGRGDMILF